MNFFGYVVKEWPNRDIQTGPKENLKIRLGKSIVFLLLLLYIYISSVFNMSIKQSEIEELAKEVTNNRMPDTKTAQTNYSDDVGEWKSDEQIEYWSDFSKVNYHDRSLMLLNPPSSAKADQYNQFHIH